MDKQKILIVSRSFHPTNSPRSFRTTELAKGFSKLGHDVTVITPKDDLYHLDFEKQYGITIKDMGKQKWKPIKVKGKGIGGYIHRALKRILNLLFLYPDIELMGIVRKALAKERDYNYDMLISIAVPFPVHFGVAKARIATHPMATTWVADCGDPFMGKENDTFHYPFFFKYVEKWFCRKADYLSVPTNGSIKAYYSEFHSKIKVIPQGFDFDDFNIDEIEPNNAVPTFAYAGGFIPGRRDPTEFLEYISSLEMDFRFHIYTRYSNYLITQFVKKGKGRIVLHDYIPRLELLEKLSSMDFVVNFENIGEKQTPSKLIDYALIKRPILPIKTGALPVEVVNEFLIGNYENQYKVENVERYKIENVCQQFLMLNTYDLPQEVNHEMSL